MSWDVFVMKFPFGIQTLTELPKDFRPGPIATRTEIAEKLRTKFPQINTATLDWLVIDGAGFSIEVNTGIEDPCTDFALHVRGDVPAVRAVIDIVELFECRGFDATTGEFLDSMPDPTKGFRQWKAYRDKVVGDTSREK